MVHYSLFIHVNDAKTCAEIHLKKTFRNHIIIIIDPILPNTQNCGIYLMNINLLTIPILYHIITIKYVIVNIQRV